MRVPDRLLRVDFASPPIVTRPSSIRRSCFESAGLIPSSLKTNNGTSLFAWSASMLLRAPNGPWPCPVFGELILTRRDYREKRFVEMRPQALAGDFTPDANGPVVGPGGQRTINLGATQFHSVLPAAAQPMPCPFRLIVTQLQARTIDFHIVVEHTSAPRTDRSAGTGCAEQPCSARKRWVRHQRLCAEVMTTIFRAGSAETMPVASSHESSRAANRHPPILVLWIHSRLRSRVALDRTRAQRSLKSDGSDLAHPNVARIQELARHPTHALHSWD